MNILELLQALLADRFPADNKSLDQINRQMQPYVDQVVQAEQNEWAQRRDQQPQQAPSFGGHDPYGSGIAGDIDRVFGGMPHNQNMPHLPNPAEPSDPGWSAQVSVPPFAGSISNWQARQSNPAMTSQQGPRNTPGRYNSGDLMDRMQRLFGQ